VKGLEQFYDSGLGGGWKGFIRDQQSYRANTYAALCGLDGQRPFTLASEQLSAGLGDSFAQWKILGHSCANN
jgi:hypothetical protein